MKLYKFLSLKKPERILEALTNERFFCPTYDKLNDPFEGIFGVTPPVPKEKVNLEYLKTLERFWRQHRLDLSKYRLCSLTKSPDNVLMWSHYAAEFTGICVAFEADDTDENFHPINYVNDLGSLRDVQSEDLLKVKLNCWRYEDEVRYITDNEYLDVSDRILKIYFGGRIECDSVFEKIVNLIMYNDWDCAVVNGSHNGKLRFI